MSTMPDSEDDSVLRSVTVKLRKRELDALIAIRERLQRADPSRAVTDSECVREALRAAGR